MAKFKIALAMAGAVSAGAYSAGVLDYLFETLALWESAKEKNRHLQHIHPDTYLLHPEYDPSVPLHDIEIDLIAGSSAGGISGSLAFLCLSDQHYLHPDDFPRNEKHYENQLLYQCWVNMDDDPSGTTLEKMLNTSDLQDQKFKNIPSLFNVKPIEDIAERAFSAVSTRWNARFPPYIHPDLDLLLTVTNLDGLPFHVRFHGDAVVHHTLIQHAAFMGYRRQGPGDPPALKNYSFPLNLALPEHLVQLKEFTLSTAAFPIALKARQPAVPGKYLEQYREFLFGPTENNLDEKMTVGVAEPQYHFLASDGGIINNKPFGLATLVMKNKAPKHIEQDQFAIIMIDPLPREEPVKKTQGSGILTVALALFNSLRNQAFFHQIGLNEVLKMHNRTRFMIVPRRKNKKEGEPHLAAAELFGFAGFLAKEYREHDYLLGRRNCQDFLRYYFAVEEDNHAQRLSTPFSEEAKQRFTFQDQGSSLPMLPIIPDLRIQKSLTEASKLPYPNFPLLNPEKIENLIDKQVMKRIKAIIKTVHLPFLLRINVALLKPFLLNKLRKSLKESIRK